jgi:hypothetical protein
MRCKSSVRVTVREIRDNDEKGATGSDMVSVMICKCYPDFAECREVGTGVGRELANNLL